jgi:hypothetical protein
LSDEAFAEKFRECATEVVSDATATALFERLSSLQDVEDAGSMLDPLRE